MKQVTLAVVLVLTLSGCSGCQEASDDFVQWTDRPLREATIGDALLLALFGGMFVGAFSSRTVKIEK